MIFKCICKKEFNSKRSLRGHKAKCKLYQSEFNMILDLYVNNEFIQTHYIDNDESSLGLIRILKETTTIDFNIFNIEAVHIIKQIKKHGFHNKSIKESGNSKGRRKKLEKTCLERFGDINALGKNSPLYEKRNKTVKERYNVENVFQIESIKEKIFSDEYYFEKYNMSRSELFSKNAKKVWENISEEEKQEWLQKSIKSEIAYRNKFQKLGQHTSKTELLIEKTLCHLNIKHEKQFLIKNSKTNRPFFGDFYLNDYNIILEIYGDYWHCNPLLYDSDFYNKTLHMYASEKWLKDENRQKLIEKQDFRYIIIWEDEIKNCENIKSLILEKIKI